MPTKFINELNSLVKDKNIHVKLSNEAVEFLITKGFDPKMGARPLQRTIDEHVKLSLSKEILFGKLTNGGIVEVVVVEGKLKLSVLDNILKNPQTEPVEEEDENTETEQ